MSGTSHQNPSFFCLGQDETEGFAAALALRAQAGDLFALTGDLGAGKSTFARAFIRAAVGNIEAEVPSPTFTLVQSYSGENYAIHHADLYRLEGPDDVYDLALDEERDDAVLLVEWPDRMPDNWWQDALEIKLVREGGVTEAGDEARRLEFSGNEARWQILLEGLL